MIFNGSPNKVGVPFYRNRGFSKQQEIIESPLGKNKGFKRWHKDDLNLEAVRSILQKQNEHHVSVEEILHQLTRVGSLSRYSQGFNHIQGGG